MIAYQLNGYGFAQKFVDGIATGEWANIETNKNFQDHLKNGGELQDAEGNVMLADAAKEFISTLP